MAPSQLKERSIKAGLFLAAVFATIIVVLILLFLFAEGYQSFVDIPADKFLLGSEWRPDQEPARYGVIPLVVGSLLVTGGALLICVPLGIGTAIFISEVAPKRLREIVKPIIEILASIPSVVYGFFGMIVLGEFLRTTFDLNTGASWFAGSLMLAIMALPTIVSVSDDALNAVPRSLREGSLAMGATRWQTIKKVVMPSATSGIAAAVVLGIGRAIGETMAVVMVTGNSAIIPAPIWNIFAPIRTITATLVIEMGEVPTGSEWYHALFGIAIILFLIVLIVNTIANSVMARIRRKQLALPPPESFGPLGKLISTIIISVILALISIGILSAAVGLMLSLVIVDVGAVVLGLFYLFYLSKREKSFRTVVKERTLSMVEKFKSTQYAARTLKYVVFGLLLAFAIWWFLVALGVILTVGILVVGAMFWLSSKFANQKIKEYGAFSILATSLIISITLLAIILAYIFSRGAWALTDWEFLTESPRQVGRAGGIFPAIVGTLLLVIGAISVALPIGILAAIYLVEYTREGPITRLLRVGVDNLNGTPSIVFGLFGFALFVRYLIGRPSLLAGILTLAFMIIPTIIRTTEEALKSVPNSMREGSLAMGATKWQTIRRVVLPAAIPGIVTGSILSLGRAAGETAPIIFTAVVFSTRYALPNSIFDPVMALPYHLFVLATNVPGGTRMSNGTATVLLVLVLTLYLVAILIRRRYEKKMRW